MRTTVDTKTQGSNCRTGDYAEHSGLSGLPNLQIGAEQGLTRYRSGECWTSVESGDLVTPYEGTRKARKRISKHH